MAIHADVLSRPDSTFPLIIKPYKLDISQFGERVRDEMKFTITNVSEQDVNVSLIAGLPKLAMVELPASIQAGKSASARVRLLPGAVTESFEKSFTIQLDDEAKSRFTIPVKRAIKRATTSAKTGS